MPYTQQKHTMVKNTSYQSDIKSPLASCVDIFASLIKQYYAHYPWLSWRRIDDDKLILSHGMFKNNETVEVRR